MRLSIWKLAVAAVILNMAFLVAGFGIGGRIASETKTEYVVKRLSPPPIRPTLTAQAVHDRMQSAPGQEFEQFGMPCAAWAGGFVPDPDPWFDQFGGKRATWTLQLCWNGTTVRT